MVSDKYTVVVEHPAFGSLNPCCNGRWSLTHEDNFTIAKLSLNPCCNGRWSLTSKADDII